jgi:L-ascorbate metabolism protein UlaG (beta-lactamase superfamily)
MDILYYGQACFKIKGKTASIIVDPFDPEIVGLKLPKDMEAQIVAKTHDHKDHNNLKTVTGEPIEVTGPGEYEIKGVAIVGISTFHDNSNGSERGKNTVYNFQIEGLNIVHLGDLGQDQLTQDQLEEIGSCDILMIPVGGTYTIYSKKATEIVSQLEPRIIIPMHYGVDGLKFPLDPVDNFLKEMGVENAEPQPKLTITKDKLPDEPQTIVLNKV